MHPSPAFKSCIHTILLFIFCPLALTFCSSPSHIPVSPSSRLLLIDYVIKDLCLLYVGNYVNFYCLCAYVRVRLRVVMCCHFDSVFLSNHRSRDIALQFSRDVYVCYCQSRNLKAVRLIGNTYTPTHTYGQASFCLPACLCRSVFSDALLAISHSHID